MLPGSDGHPRAAAHTAIPQPAGAPDGADENQDQHAADGSWSELQQAKAPQGRLFPRTIGQQPRHQRKLAFTAPSVSGDRGAAKQTGPALALLYDGKNKRAMPIGPHWRWPGNWWLI